MDFIKIFLLHFIFIFLGGSDEASVPRVVTIITMGILKIKQKDFL